MTSAEIMKNFKAINDRINEEVNRSWNFLQQYKEETDEALFEANAVIDELTERVEALEAKLGIESSEEENNEEEEE